MSFISHAQNFEDVILWRALKHVDNGRYLDIGAWDATIDNVSLAFYERGWRGAHVEPSPQHAQSLRDARPGDKVFEAAVTTTPDPVTLWEVEGTGMHTIKQETLVYPEERGFTHKSIEVQTITLAEIFEQLGPEPIHWLKIDVEGAEKDALESWGTSAQRPWVVLLEATLPGSPTPNHQDWDHLMVELGYKFVYFDNLNRFYVHQDHVQLEEHFKIGPNIFDEFNLAIHCGVTQNISLLTSELQRQNSELISSIDTLNDRIAILRKFKEKNFLLRDRMTAIRAAHQRLLEENARLRDWSFRSIKARLKRRLLNPVYHRLRRIFKS